MNTGHSRWIRYRVKTSRPKTVSISWLPRAPTNFWMQHDTTTIPTHPMATPRPLIAPLSRLGTCPISIARPHLSRFAPLPQQTIRCATTKAQPKKKKKARNTFLQYDLRKAEQFSLIDAMQYACTSRVACDAQLRKTQIYPRLRGRPQSLLV